MCSSYSQFYIYLSFSSRNLIYIFFLPFCSSSDFVFEKCSRSNFYPDLEDVHKFTFIYMYIKRFGDYKVYKNIQWKFMLHIELRTTNETSCTNLFPRKLITCPTFHVCPTFGDSPLFVVISGLWEDECSRCLGYQVLRWRRSDHQTGRNEWLAHLNQSDVIA